MVKEYGSIKSHSGYLADALGPALGHGLAEFSGQYLANKALDSVLNNPSLKDSPPSERASSLQRALMPFGERGQRILNSRLKIEQQQMQEQQELQQQKQQAQEQSILGEILYGGGVDPKKFSQLPVRSQFKLAAVQQDLQNAKSRNEQEQLTNERFSTGYQAVQSGNEKAFSSVINDPQTPHSVKRQLLDYKNQREGRANMQERESRQRQNLVLNAYRQKIAQLNSQMKETSLPKDRKPIADQINKLIRLRDQDLKKLATDPEAYPSLSLWNTDAQNFMPDESQIAQGEAQPKGQGAQQSGGFFDSLKSFFGGKAETEKEAGTAQQKPQQENAEALLNSLTDEQVAELFQESGGDMERAKKLALERYGR